MMSCYYACYAKLSVTTCRKLQHHCDTGHMESMVTQRPWQLGYPNVEPDRVPQYHLVLGSGPYALQYRSRKV